MDNNPKHNKPQPSKPPVKDAKNWLAYSGMTFEMFGTIGVCAALGYFLDKKLHTAPVLVIIFLFIGLILAFYRVYKQLM
ncbi:MAG: putative F0F1-ATPase subunit Ca2+/Mg2+ transporter [Bacteroidota bacterium]|nr:putative F0F1-ATPase subunit Ca2+/Mg2+ transporter [Bacteroidota bacterium]